MIYIILSILLNTLIFTLFKVFANYKVNTLQTIVVNYVVCVITGSLFIGTEPFHHYRTFEPWFYWALLTGGLFILVFSLLGYSIQKNGLTLSTVTNKLSLIIPVIFAVVVYHEPLSYLKILGVIIAFPAIYFSTQSSEKHTTSSILLLAALFIFSGSLDTVMKYVETRYLQENSLFDLYLIQVFATAAFIGSIIIGIRTYQGKLQLHYRNLISGVILGVPNYFSMYFFLKFLQSDFLDSSAAIPVNNIGIVLLSGISAMLFFKEKATGIKLLGLALSILSILLLYFSKTHG